MSFWIDTFVPSMAIVIILSAVLTPVYFFYRMVKSLSKNFGLYLKYKILKRDYSDQDVSYCMKAIDSNMSRVNLHKLLLISGVKEKRSDNVLYVYDQIVKMKGGEINYGQKISR